MIKMIVVSILILSGSVSADPDEERLEEMLTNIRAATGFRARNLILNGTGEASGLETSFLYYFTPDGRFRIDTDNNLKTIVGFDGKTGWLIDYSGMPYPLQGWALEVEQLIAWFISGYWLDPDSPVELDLSEDGRITAQVPSGVVLATIEIDSVTSIPNKLIWRIYDADCNVTLEDFHDGIARRVTIKRNGEFTDIKDIELHTKSEISDDIFHPIESRPNDTVFSKEKDDTIEVRRTDYGLFLIRPRVDGKDVGWFTVDTGAGRNVIDTRYTEHLMMDIVGTSTAIGVGGTIDVNYRQCKSIEIGPLEIKNPIFYEIDFGESGVDNRGGILGYDFFIRCLVELDLEEDRITIYEPDIRNNRDVAWQEFIFHDNIPAVYCLIEGDIKGLFTIDTGSDTNVALHKKFVDDHNLLYDRDVQKVYLGGVGGKIPCFYGSLEWFELAGHRFEHPEVLFAGGDQGVFTDQVTAGIIGRGFLSSFRLLIDYPNQSIAFIEKDQLN